MSIDWAKWRRAGAKLSHDGEIAITAVAAIAASTLHLHDLAKLCHETQPWLLPASIDAAAMVAARMWLRAGTPTAARNTAAGATLFYAVLSIAANGAVLLVRHEPEPPVWLMFGVGAVPGATGIVMVILLALAKLRQQAPAALVDPASVIAELSDQELFRISRERVAELAAGDDRQRVASAEIFCREFQEVGRPTTAMLFALSDYQAKQAVANASATQDPDLVGAAAP